MNWTTPKTDWQVREYVNGLYSGDWFNLADYDRLRNNLACIRQIAQTVLGASVSFAEMPSRAFGDYPRAGDFNALEGNLLALVNGTGLTPPNYYGKTDWAANGPFLTFSDLNRLESAMLWLYTALIDQAEYEAFIPSGADGLTDADGENVLTMIPAGE